MVELCLQIVFKTNLKSIASKLLVQNISESSRCSVSGDRCHLDTVGNIFPSISVYYVYISITKKALLDLTYFSFF